MLFDAALMSIFVILSSSASIETGLVNVRLYLERETRKKEKALSLEIHTCKE